MAFNYLPYAGKLEINCWVVNLKSLSNNQQIGLCIYNSGSSNNNINFSKFVLSKEWSLRGHLWYDYDTNACVDRNCDHYTQVVWNESVTVGCTRAQCRTGYWFISCSYYPEEDDGGGASVWPIGPLEEQHHHRVARDQAMEIRSRAC